MIRDERFEYVKYRLQSAHKTLEAARVLADNEFWNSAVNRLYYALFYAVNALLVLNEIHTKSHTATKSQFSQHFIKTGKFDKKYGMLLSELFDWRQKGDYANMFDYTKETVSPLFQPVSEMLEQIEKEINNTMKQ